MAIKHEESQQPNNPPLSQTRRSALKQMLVGTGVAAGAAVLPDKWSKPMVDKVLVPAHAQTSTTTPQPPRQLRTVPPNISLTIQKTAIRWHLFLEIAAHYSIHG